MMTVRRSVTGTRTTNATWAPSIFRFVEETGREKDGGGKSQRNQLVHFKLKVKETKDNTGNLSLHLESVSHIQAGHIYLYTCVYIDIYGLHMAKNVLFNITYHLIAALHHLLGGLQWKTEQKNFLFAFITETEPCIYSYMYALFGH